eukprot:CFRG4369T1
MEPTLTLITGFVHSNLIVSGFAVADPKRRAVKTPKVGLTTLFMGLKTFLINTTTVTFVWFGGFIIKDGW